MTRLNKEDKKTLVKGKQRHIFVDEPVIKKQIRLLIARKKKLLIQLTELFERTREELMYIKSEYERRVGIVQAKLSDLDDRIFELKKLHDLLLKNISYTDAIKLLRDRERAREEKENGKFKEQEDEQKEIFDKMKKMKPGESDELKKLWRKLAFRYHPDLVHEDSDKKSRELMMKRVNDAYARGDLVGLKTIESEGSAAEDVTSDATMQDLEQNLMDTEACVRRVRQKIKAFKKLEWYEWKERVDEAKKLKKDFFVQIEKGAIGQIKEKELEIATLERKVSKYK
ncbi:MAG: hypothetical protein HZA95_01775 [Candidatus Vogelbacteria bacterium]|nr:hypothetical protein [Candidatus Vogelbacteria bacterium]